MRLSEILTQPDSFSATPSKSVRLNEAMSEEKAAGEVYFTAADPNFRPLTDNEKKDIDIMDKMREYKLSPTDYYSGASPKAEAFFQGILPLGKTEIEREALRRLHGTTMAVGNLAGLMATGGLTAGIGPVVTYAKPLASLPTVARYVAGKMAQTGATFGIKELSDNMAELLSGDKKDFQTVVTDTLTAGSFGAGLGAVGSIASPVIRIPAEAAYGFTTAKISGATDMEAGTTAATFALFGMFNTRNLAREYKIAAYTGARQALVDRMIEKGVKPEKADYASRRFFDWAMNRKGGYDNVTVEDFDKFSQAMRKGWKVFIEPEMQAVTQITAPQAVVSKPFLHEDTNAFLSKMPEKGGVVPIPVLKDTNDAISYGDTLKGNKAQIQNIMKVMQENITKMSQAQEPNEIMKLAYQNQLLRETIEAATDTGSVANVRAREAEIAKEGAAPAATTPMKEAEIAKALVEKEQIKYEENQRAIDELENEYSELKTVDDLLKGRVQRGGDIREELKAFPKGFFVKSGIMPDEALAEINAAGLGEEFGSLKELADYITNTRARMKEIELQIAELKPQKVSHYETTLLKEKIRNIERGIRAGEAMAKQDIKTTQKDVVAIIKAADLEPKDRAKFISTITNVQTNEQLAKKLPEIYKRIDEMIDKRIRRGIISDIKKKMSKRVLNKMRPEFKTLVENILEGIDPVKRSKAKLSGLKNLLEYIEKEPDNLIPKARLDELKLLEKTSVADISTEDLKSISDTVEHYLKLNQLKNKLLIKGKLREQEKVISQAIDNISSVRAKDNRTLTGLSSLEIEKDIEGVKRFYTLDSWNAELKGEVLDSKDIDENTAVIGQVVYGGIDKGVSNQYIHYFRALDFFTEKLQGINVSKWSSAFQVKKANIEQVNIDISRGRKLTMTPAERIAFYLHSQNEQNLKHIIDGGFSFKNTPFEIIDLKIEDIQKINDSVTPDEKKVADAISEYFNTIQKDAINDTSLNLMGFNIATVENYFPIKTNFLDRFHDELIKQGKYMQATIEGMGIFKERQDTKEALILEDAFVTAMRSIKQSAAYVGLAEPLRSAKSMLYDNRFNIEMRKNGLGAYIDDLQNYVKKVEGDALRTDHIDKLTQELLNKLDVAAIGANPWVILKQPASLVAAVTEIDGRYLQAAGFGPISPETVVEMETYSPQLRMRYRGNVTLEIGEIASIGEAAQFFTGKHTLSEAITMGIQRADRVAIGAIWRAAKIEVAEKNPGLPEEDLMPLVAARAEKIIRRTQPTFHVKDRSSFAMKRDVFSRSFIRFTSQRNKNYIMVSRAISQYNRSGKTFKDKSDFIGKLIAVMIVQSFLIMLADELRDKFYNKEKKEKFLTRAISGIVKTVFGNVYIVNNIVSGVESAWKSGGYRGMEFNTPIGDWLNDVIKATVDTGKTVQNAITQERYRVGKKRGEYKWQESFKRAGQEVVDVVGAYKGIPVPTIRKIISNSLKMITGGE